MGLWGHTEGLWAIMERKTNGAISYRVSAVWKHEEADAGAQITLLLFIFHSVQDPKLAKINKTKWFIVKQFTKIIKNSL